MSLYARLVNRAGVRPRPMHAVDIVFAGGLKRGEFAPHLCKATGPEKVIILETARLTLRRLTLDDAQFMLGLLNEPSFIANIGDRGVRTLEDARQFLLNGPLASYERNGYGHYLTQLKGNGTPIGICGLINREFINEIDVGFAFLPAFWSQGYASEAASAVMAYGRSQLGLKRIVAVVSPGNTGSIRVLEKLGLRYSGPTQLAVDAEVIHLFA